jgi:hypothetical protein
VEKRRAAGNVLGALVALLVLLFAATALARPRMVIPPGREAKAQALIADVGFGRDLGDGYRFESISLAPTEVVYELWRGDHAVGRLRLVPAEDASSGDVVTKSFALKRRRLEELPRVDALLDAAAQSVVKHDDGDFYVPEETALPGPRGDTRKLSVADQIQHPDTLPRVVAAVCAGTAFLLGALAIALRRLRPSMVAFDFKPTHMIPAGVQALIFLYWGIYWRPLRYYVPYVLLQLAFAYVADAAVSLATRRKLVLGLAPVPIVGSINLFVQFEGRSIFMPLAAIFLAFLSKALLRRKDGTHIFNPSAFGVTVIALLNLAFPALGNGDNAFRFNLPPNMTEVIFLLALLPQSRRPIVLVSIAAVLAMAGYHGVTGFNYFKPLWAPVFLSITLLGTDPATTPKTGAGRVIFGALLGLGFVVAATILDKSGHNDFYGKVIALPFVNPLSPWCDRAGARLPALVQRALAPAQNRFHMLAWIALVAVWIQGGIKRGAFEPKEHETAETPLLARGPDGAVTCAANPMFCTPFTFRDEIRGWRARLHGAAP